MNYFELYPGDYLRDTTRLTLVEHGAYLRLLMTYYAEEQPLPGDLGELYVIAGATDPAGKKAVKKVAEKHFPVGPDGLRHNSRADDEIAKAQERMEGADERKSNDAERKRRSRERRAALFAALREVGIVPEFDVTMAALRSLVAENVTRDKCVTLGVTPRDKSRPVTRDGTATRPQTPAPTRASATTARTGSSVEPPSPAARAPTATARACLAMRRAGLVQVNPAHPRLIEALEAGVTVVELAATAAEALTHTPPKGFVWAIAAAHGRRIEAAQGASHARNSTQPRRLSAVERVEAAIHHARAERGELDTGDVIEGQATRVSR